jgi:hypothetical protein
MFTIGDLGRNVLNLFVLDFLVDLDDAIGSNRSCALAWLANGIAAFRCGAGEYSGRRGV